MEFLKIVCKYRTGPVNHADVMQAEEGEGRKVIEGANELAKSTGNRFCLLPEKTRPSTVRGPARFAVQYSAKCHDSECTDAGQFSKYAWKLER